MSLGYFVHNIDAFVIKFPENWVIPGIRWYGISYLIGFFGAFLLLSIYRRCKLVKLEEHESQNFLIYLLISILIGGRLGYVFLYDFQFFSKNPVHIFYFWNGGMASHGGFIGALLFLIFFKKRTGYSIRSSGDLVVTLVPIGLFFGRIANFINCEVIGRVTDVPWAVIFSKAGICEPRHPSQIYEAILEGLFLLIYTQYRVWFSEITKKISGHLACEFMIIYSVLRIFVEFFREPDASLLFGATRGQFYSAIMLVFSTILLLVLKNTRRSGRNVFYEENC